MTKEELMNKVGNLTKAIINDEAYQELLKLMQSLEASETYQKLTKEIKFLQKQSLKKPSLVKEVALADKYTQLETIVEYQRLLQLVTKLNETKENIKNKIDATLFDIYHLK